MHPAVARALIGMGLWALSIQVAFAEGRPVQVRPAGPEALEAQPRQVVTTAFRVTNNSSQRRELVAQAKLPEDWKLITTEFPFELEPGRSDVRLVSFLVPRTALAERYPITCLVQDRTVPSISDQWTIHVVVLPVTDLVVKLMRAPRTVIAGEPYVASFIVANQGNVPLKVQFSARTADQLPTTLGPESCMLGPSHSQIVAVTVRTQRETARQTSQSIRFAAVAPEARKDGLRAEATCLFEIIPRISSAEDPYVRLPVQLTFRSAMSDREGSRSSGFQAEVAGGGPVDEGRTEFVDFLFRGPDLSAQSIYGARDECRFSYWNDKYEVHLGDRVYSLTPLTELFTYARGVEGKLKLGQFTLGGYHAGTRWQEPQEQQTAAYAQYQAGPDCLFSLNYLRKRADDGPSRKAGLGNRVADDLWRGSYPGDDGGDSPLRDAAASPLEGQVLSLRSQFRPLRGMSVDLEYGLGDNDSRGRGGDDNAYRAEVHGELSRIIYYFKLIHAGPAYPGYYNDMDYLSGGFAAPIYGNLRVHADYHREKNNLDLNPARGIARLETYRRVGLDYRFRSGTYLSLDYEKRERQDRLFPPQLDAEEDTVGLTVAHQFKRLSFMAAAEAGTLHNRLTGESRGLQEYRLSAHFTATRAQTYGAYVEYRDDGGLGDEKSRNITGGLNATWLLGGRTALSVDARRSEYQGRFDGSRDVLEFRLLHMLNGGRKLSLSARHTARRGADSGSENALFLEYGIPLGVPLARKKSVGGVRGRVYDEETGQGIENTLVRLNGSTAITDKNGNYVFPAVKPGAYCLAPDTSQLAVEKTPSQQSPGAVAVVGGQDAVADIGFTRSATVSGRVAVFRPKDHEPPPGSGRAVTSTNGNGLVEAGGLPNALLELTSETEVLRAMSDAQGRFSFGNVRPGKWILKAQAANLPDYHYVEKDTFELDLRPGESLAITVRVVPKTRPVRIIKEGGELKEGPSKPK